MWCLCCALRFSSSWNCNRCSFSILGKNKYQISDGWNYFWTKSSSMLTPRRAFIPIDVLSPSLGKIEILLTIEIIFGQTSQICFTVHALFMTHFRIIRASCLKIRLFQGVYLVVGVGMRSFLSFVVTLFGVVFAVPSSSLRSDHVVHEVRAAEPIHWTKTGRLNSNSVLPMRFGLVQQNLHMLEEMLMSVSNPDSPKYAQHFTPMEVVDAFAPSKETISAVTNWLVDSGISRDRLRLSSNKGWIHVNASTSEVENLLNTEYHVYSHPSGDTQTGEEWPYLYPKIFYLH